jgi:hypothetical protein
VAAQETEILIAIITGISSHRHPSLNICRKMGYIKPFQDVLKCKRFIVSRKKQAEVTSIMTEYVMYKNSIF